MAKLTVEIVTAERQVLTDEADMRHLRYGVEGQLKPTAEEREPPLPNGAG